MWSRLHGKERVETGGRTSAERTGGHRSKWLYPTGLTLVVLGAMLTATLWFMIYGVPLFVVGVIFIALSEESTNAKLLSIFLPVGLLIVIAAVLSAVITGR